MLVGYRVGQSSGSDKIKLNADYRLSGPYVHCNLEVFFIHGKAGMGSKRFISLAEAMEKGVVVIDETGDVNHLSAANRSDKDYVFTPILQKPEGKKDSLK